VKQNQHQEFEDPQKLFHQKAFEACNKKIKIQTLEI
jgi:hypothetical protein